MLVARGIFIYLFNPDKGLFHLQRIAQMFLAGFVGGSLI